MFDVYLDFSVAYGRGVASVSLQLRVQAERPFFCHGGKEIPLKEFVSDRIFNNSNIPV